MKVYILAVWFLVFLMLLPLSCQAYERVISLSPQITESIYLLGAQEQLTGVTSFCKRPKDALAKEKIGTPLRPDIEKIVSMKPDLVLGTREGNPPMAIARLERFGLSVRYFGRPKTLGELLQNFLLLARMLGREDKGHEVLSRVRAALPGYMGVGAPKVLWQVGAEPLMVASAGSLAGDIIRYAGGENVIGGEAPYPRINMEEVMVRKPDVIVLMDMGYNVGMEMERWRKYLERPNFVVMDAYTVGSPTPLSFLESVERLGKALRALEKKRQSR